MLVEGQESNIFVQKTEADSTETRFQAYSKSELCEFNETARGARSKEVRTVNGLPPTNKMLGIP